MFGIKKRFWIKQLKRAANVENCLKAGIFDHQVRSIRRKPSDVEGALFAGAVNDILAWDIQQQVQMLEGSREDAETIHSMARQILSSDPNLERLVIRLLYEIASLGHLLDRDEWSRNFLHKHPRIMEILAVAQPKHPELFRDIEEIEFKALFERFIDKYLPDMKETAGSLFK